MPALFAALGGTALNMYGSQQAADQQEGATKAALNYQKPYRKAGVSALNDLASMFGNDPTANEKGDWAKEIKASLKPTLKNLKRNERKAIIDEAIKADYTKRTDARAKDSNFGFFNQRFGNDQFVKEPGYDFRLKQGEQGINNALAARGNFESGAALKSLARYNQDYGSNEYNNAYNRYTRDQTNMYNRLSNMAGLGQTAVQSSMPLRQDLGNIQSANTQAQIGGIGDLLGAGLSAFAPQKGNPVNVSAKNTQGLFPVK